MCLTVINHNQLHGKLDTPFTTISKLPRLTAAAAHRATVHCLSPLRNHVHTITYDNGKEFARHQKPAIFYAPRSSLPRPITRGNAV